MGSKSRISIIFGISRVSCGTLFSRTAQTKPEKVKFISRFVATLLRISHGGRSVANWGCVLHYRGQAALHIHSLTYHISGIVSLHYFRYARHRHSLSFLACSRAPRTMHPPWFFANHYLLQMGIQLDLAPCLAIKLTLEHFLSCMTIVPRGSENNERMKNSNLFICALGNSKPTQTMKIITYF